MSFTTNAAGLPAIKIRFTPYAFRKALDFMRHKPLEVGLFGMIRKFNGFRGGGFTLIEDWYCPAQEVSGAAVDYDDESIRDLQKLFMEASAAPAGTLIPHPGMWFHTHPGNSCQPSGTDLTTWRETYVERAETEWACMLIMAQDTSLFGKCWIGGHVGVEVPVDFGPFLYAGGDEVRGWTNDDQAQVVAEYNLKVTTPDEYSYSALLKLAKEELSKDETKKNLSPEEFNAEAAKLASDMFLDSSKRQIPKKTWSSYGGGYSGGYGHSGSYSSGGGFSGLRPDIALAWQNWSQREESGYWSHRHNRRLYKGDTDWNEEDFAIFHGREYASGSGGSSRYPLLHQGNTSGTHNSGKTGFAEEVKSTSSLSSVPRRSLFVRPPVNVDWLPAARDCWASAGETPRYPTDNTSVALLEIIPQDAPEKSSLWWHVSPGFMCTQIPGAIWTNEDIARLFGKYSLLRLPDDKCRELFTKKPLYSIEGPKNGVGARLDLSNLQRRVWDHAADKKLVCLLELRMADGGSVVEVWDPNNNSCKAYNYMRANTYPTANGIALKWKELKNLAFAEPEAQYDPLDPLCWDLSPDADSLAACLKDIHHMYPNFEFTETEFRLLDLLGYTTGEKGTRKNIRYRGCTLPMSEYARRVLAKNGGPPDLRVSVPVTTATTPATGFADSKKQEAGFSVTTGVNPPLPPPVTLPTPPADGPNDDQGAWMAG